MVVVFTFRTKPSPPGSAATFILHESEQPALSMPPRPQRYGRPDAALDDTAIQYDRTGTIWEFFHPLGGKPEELARKPHTKQNQPWRDYIGHNPLFAMARLWEQCR